MNQDHIRNFAIIAHIDHGKSTLADRMLEMTGTVEKRDMQEQLLDSNPIERERGITISLAPVRMSYQLSAVSHQPDISKQLSAISCQPEKTNSAESRKQKAESYTLNLIDTPGHVDFGYEVSRSLAACEGAILVVDTTQGVQAQTLANLAQARQHKLVIIPVINKIDLPNARIDETLEALETLGFKKEEVIQISAKTGQNVDRLLEAIVERIPPPHGNPLGQARALVFSSHYDSHKGVVIFVRLVDGSISFGKTSGQAVGVYPELSEGFESASPAAPEEKICPTGPDRITFLASGAEVTPIDMGYFTPGMTSLKAVNSRPGLEFTALLTGEVGYIATGLKDARFAKVGDTVTTIYNSHLTIDKKNKTNESNVKGQMLTVVPLSGYKEPKPMVFLGLYPINSDDTGLAREAMERLQLSDSAFTFRPIHSLALGNGFHCGFLGLLHAEIVQERLSREFNLNMIATAPSVEYQIKLKGMGSYQSPASPAGRSAVSLQPEKTNFADSRKLKAESSFSIQSAAECPDPALIDEVREPVMQVAIYSPKQYVGAIMTLAQDKRAQYIDLVYKAEQAEFTYLIPLSEMIIDFFDRLKSVTEGYASLDYEFYEYQPVKVVKLDILVNKEKIDALSVLLVEDQALRRGREIVEKLATVIPRSQFLIPIQAAIGGQVVARADVKAYRKDVTQKLYGGDRSRKDKLLDKQKKGKAKMKLIGRVEIPQSAFLEVLKT